jgi:cobalt/nickel transport system permease protein
MTDHHGTDLLAPAHAGPSYLAGVDPRVRIVAAAAFAIAVAAAHRLPTMAAALAAAVLALGLARMPPRMVLRRVWPLEVVILLLLALLPWTAAGPANAPADARWPAGVYLGAAIALKANAIVLGWLALLGSMDAAALGHALAHLHMPRKLVHLLLFTTGYLEVLGREYGRLRWAMKVRSFRPRMNLHTYRAYGYLVGMLLVRSFDRSERVVAAMKCRGFRGRFYLLDHFAFAWRRDVAFSAAAALVLAAILTLEWM